jgi:hypothetical protein
VIDATQVQQLTTLAVGLGAALLAPEVPDWRSAEFKIWYRRTIPGDAHGRQNQPNGYHDQ